MSMYTGRLVFSQIMDFFPYRHFATCVRRYKGDHRIRTFSCRDQLLCMLFAQLTYRESLRDIEVCLRGLQTKLYHVGIRGTVARSTLADANEQRDWRIYAEVAQRLILRAKSLYQDEDLGLDLDASVYALDATTIDLCMALFPWARFRRSKSAIKLHVLLNLQGNIPEFIHISDGKCHEVNILDELIPMAGAFYVMDRGYLDFQRLFQVDRTGAFFVTRAKKNFQFQRRYSHPVDRSTGMICDQTIVLSTYYPSKQYPKPLRRIRFREPETGKSLVFLTNHFELDALTIAELYKARWQIELFFKWIKQHLRIKAFYGTTPNAVKTQIWIAICAYLLVAILKKELQLKQSMYTILQILSVTLFEQLDVRELIADFRHPLNMSDDLKQLDLFSF